MPYDRKKLMQPDFYPEQNLGWQDFGEDQPINMGPAAGAFKQRFMQGNMGTGRTSMTNSLPEMDAPMAPNAGGEPLKKGLGKSL